MLVEENVAKNSGTSNGFWMKSTISYVTVRANEAIDNVKGTQLSLGYGSAINEVPHNHEFCWNRVLVPVNQDGPAILMVMSDFYRGQSYNTFFYRNTIVNGYSVMRFMGKMPFETDANMIVTNKAIHWNLAEMKTTIPNVVAGPMAGLVSGEKSRVLGSDFGKVGADVAITPAPVPPLNPRHQ